MKKRKKTKSKAQAKPDFSDIAELGEEFWNEAELVYPEPKQAISIRLDSDVLEWFKAQGPGYQSRINAVLRSYVSSQQ